MNGELENAKQVTVGYGGTAGWREDLKCKKLLSWDVEIVIRKVVACHNRFFSKKLYIKI
jgi:hypothetical protein